MLSPTERLLPGAILRDLTEEEMEEYRRPFRREGEDRRPTLTFPREIPIEGEPKVRIRRGRGRPTPRVLIIQRITNVRTRRVWSRWLIPKDTE